MKKSRSFDSRALFALGLAILQAGSAFSGTISFTQDGLNARSGNSFRGTKNVLATVPKGTEGEVLDRWELPSGNYGIKVKITKLGATGTRLKIDEEIWVYYHRDSRSRRVELLDDDGKAVANANEGKWAIALSSFRTQKSEPVKEVACATCTTNTETQKETKPLPEETVKTLEKIVEQVNSDEEKKNDQVADLPKVDVAVEEVMAYIANDQKANLSKRQARSTSDAQNRVIAQTLIDECRKQGVPIELALGIIQQESHFYSKSHSGAGARGLMQIMPVTYRDNTKRRDYNTLYDPIVNIRIGLDEIAGYLRKYNGDVELALQAYNWGPGNVDNFLAGKCSAKHRKNGVCTMPKETLAYAPSVLGYREAYLAYENTTKTSVTVASTN
jgi:hypothetical protein